MIKFYYLLPLHYNWVIIFNNNIIKLSKKFTFFFLNYLIKNIIIGKKLLFVLQKILINRGCLKFESIWYLFFFCKSCLEKKRAVITHQCKTIIAHLLTYYTLNIKKVVLLIVIFIGTTTYNNHTHVFTLQNIFFGLCLIFHCH